MKTKAGTTMSIDDVISEIRRQRLALGMTQEQAARKIGHSSRQNWCSIEAGRKGVSNDLLQRMAEAVGLSIDFTATIRARRTGDRKPGNGKSGEPGGGKSNARRRPADKTG